MKWRHTPPYEQQFLFKVNKDFAGKPLLSFYTEKFKYKNDDYWRSIIENGDVTINHQGVDAETILNLDDEIRTKRHDVQEPDVNAELNILYDQDGLLVLNKSAPIPVHPSGRYFKNSLTTVLRETFPEKKFHTIHRLDKWTTGVLLLATEVEMAKHLHHLVETKQIQKQYGVIAIGTFPKEPFQIEAPIGRKAGAHRGTGNNITEAKACLTEFETVFAKEIRGQPHTFLKANPVTGRTNQIRVHVQTAGGYVLNDPLYSPYEKSEEEMIPFLGLHCREMRFALPTGENVSFQAPWPDEFFNLFPELAF